ncbi:MAG TPA: hypothetical protein VFN44_20420 [Solirubrobacteraceae bacterium]|nr:hypothetical protein [Solirubrobacteraceae bacterium]
MRKRILVPAALLCAMGTLTLSTAASAQLQAGDVLVVDNDVPPVSTGVLFRVDPQTGARTVLSNFGAGNPTAVAVEADGDVLVTDTDAGTDPAGGTSEWGALYRLGPERTILSDFGAGSATGRTPRAVAVEPDGGILVINASGGTSNRALLVRVDADTGARSVVSDFGNGSQGSLGVEPRGVAVEPDGEVLVIDAQAGGAGQGELVRIDPHTGMRTSVSNFGAGADPGSNPTSLAIEADGRVLVTDEGHPSTTPLGLLFRVDPLSGGRAILSDFNTGADTGREPEGVALESDGQILVVDKHAGPLTHGMLFRVDPISGARSVVSDFGAGADQGNDPLAVAVVPPTRGTVAVTTAVVNDDGGGLQAGDVTLHVAGGDATPASFAGQGPPGTAVTLAPGAYDVSADPLPGYALSFSPGCAGTIAAGEERACTVTADDEPGTLVVVGAVVNDDGGAAVPADWAISVTGGDPIPATFAGAAAPGTTVVLDAGAYSVSAVGPAGYGTAASSGCTGTLALGETRTCTITGDDVPGSLRVVARVVNDHGGSAVSSDIAVTVTGGNASPGSFSGQGEPGTLVGLDAGSYVVGATGPPGYAISLSADCAATIGLAETRTCTITADDPPPAVPTCGGKPATIVGGAGPTDIRGTKGNDVIVDLDGDNMINGQGGDDTICTGPGNDRIDGGGGFDRCAPGTGSNTVKKCEAIG